MAKWKNGIATNENDETINFSSPISPCMTHWNRYEYTAYNDLQTLLSHCLPPTPKPTYAKTGSCTYLPYPIHPLIASSALKLSIMRRTNDKLNDRQEPQWMEHGAWMRWRDGDVRVNKIICRIKGNYNVRVLYFSYRLIWSGGCISGNLLSCHWSWFFATEDFVEATPPRCTSLWAIQRMARWHSRRVR